MDFKLPRRSSSLMKGSRASSQDNARAYQQQGNHLSRSVERSSKIPVRGLSQPANGPGSSKDQLIKRSNTYLDVADTPRGTPHGSYKITPQNELFIPRLYSSKKKMGVKDNRNLLDKEYQRESHAMVLSYFQQNAPMVLKGSDIRPMTIKLFIDMINHLFEKIGICKLDELVQFTTSNYEKDLITWIKILEYPGSISKGWIQTVNVPQYWHHVLGLLSWLVTFVQCESQFNFECVLQHVADSDTWRNQEIRYLLSCLQSYHEKDKGEDAFEEISKNLLTTIQSLKGTTVEDVKELEIEIEKLRGKVNDSTTQAEKDLLDELEQRLSMAVIQDAKDSEEVENIRERLNKIEAEAGRKERIIGKLGSDMEKCRQEVSALTKKLESQPMTVTEVAELRKKCDFLMKEIAFTEKEYGDYDKLLCRYEDDGVSKRDKILQNAHSFNTGMIQLAQQIPQLRNLRARVNPESATVVEDVEKLIISLQDLKDKMQSDYKNLISAKAAKQKKIVEVKSELQIATEKEESITASITETKVSLEKMDNDNVKEKESLLAEIDELKKKEEECAKKLIEIEKLNDELVKMQERNVLLDRAKALMAVKEEEMWKEFNLKLQEVIKRIRVMEEQQIIQREECEQRITKLVASHKSVK